jgi:hypothetical protein
MGIVKHRGTRSVPWDDFRGRGLDLDCGLPFSLSLNSVIVLVDW